MYRDPPKMLIDALFTDKEGTWCLSATLSHLYHSRTPTHREHRGEDKHVVLYSCRYRVEDSSVLVRGVRARSARIYLFSFTYSELSLVSLVQPISLILVTLSLPSLAIISLERYEYSTRASRSNTGTQVRKRKLGRLNSTTELIPMEQIQSIRSLPTFDLMVLKLSAAASYTESSEQEYLDARVLYYILRSLGHQDSARIFDSLKRLVQVDRLLRVLVSSRSYSNKISLE